MFFLVRSTISPAGTSLWPRPLTFGSNCPPFVASIRIHVSNIYEHKCVCAHTHIFCPSRSLCLTATEPDTDADTDTYRHTQTDARAHARTDTHPRHRRTDRRTHTQIDSQTAAQTDSQTDRQTDRQTHRHTDAQTDRRTDRNLRHSEDKCRVRGHSKPKLWVEEPGRLLGATAARGCPPLRSHLEMPK